MGDEMKGRVDSHKVSQDWNENFFTFNLVEKRFVSYMAQRIINCVVVVVVCQFLLDKMKNHPYHHMISAIPPLVVDDTGILYKTKSDHRLWRLQSSRETSKDQWPEGQALSRNPTLPVAKCQYMSAAK
ncbi:hypothetical protein HAX54_016101 [Datura stramonium]|uniref:Uncharacterized protein n=1 Tax=Datura stramonium TaxID=4076 RepID=A0ABS8RZP5_DATST|nr:hypothetical protein [Datura stramonium]